MAFKAPKFKQPKVSSFEKNANRFAKQAKARSDRWAKKTGA